MTLSELRNIRHQINTVFYSNFDFLSGEARLTFQSLLEEIDTKITTFEEF